MCGKLVSVYHNRFQGFRLSAALSATLYSYMRTHYIQSHILQYVTL